MICHTTKSHLTCNDTVFRFKQMISDCSKLRLSETLLGYAKVLPLIENCCSFGEIIVVGGGAKAIALYLAMKIHFS